MIETTITTRTWPARAAGSSNAPELGDYYWLEIRLGPVDPGESSAGAGVVSVSPSQMAAGDDTPLFATSLGNDRILELDTATGDQVSGFVPPETLLGGGEGLALDGDELFFLGRSSDYPYLYRLDAQTGQVLERITTWFGSGFYGGITVINGVLYLVDKLEDAIYALPTSLEGGVRRLAVGETSGISMFGPIAGAAIPDRLLVTDATDSSTVHHVSSVDGTVVASTSLGTHCECAADIDRDGDVDDDDASGSNGRGDGRRRQLVREQTQCVRSRRACYRRFFCRRWARRVAMPSRSSASQT